MDLRLTLFFFEFQLVKLVRYFAFNFQAQVLKLTIVWSINYKLSDIFSRFGRISSEMFCLCLFLTKMIEFQNTG